MLTTCILSFNHPNLTAKCVESVLRFVPYDSVLLTHNGSREENISTLQEKFPQIEHLVVPENRGFTQGANITLKSVFKNSPWAFFVTNDCELISKPHPPEKNGLYAPLIYRRSLRKVDSLGATFNPITGRLRHLRSPNMNSIASSSRLRHFYVPGTAFYLDRNTFTALKGFDESLHTYWEDVDFSVRAHKAGLHLGVSPETQLIHKVGKTCHKDPFYTNVLFRQNRITISKRHAPKWGRLLQKIWI